MTRDEALALKPGDTVAYCPSYMAGRANGPFRLGRVRSVNRRPLRVLVSGANGLPYLFKAGSVGGIRLVSPEELLTWGDAP